MAREGGVQDEVIEAVLTSDASKNLLCRPGGLKLREMAELGAARISLGPMLFHMTLRHLERAAEALGRLDDDGLWGGAMQD